MSGDDPWSVEHDPGPLVRAFAVTRGRAGRNVHGLDMLTLVIAVRPETDLPAPDREYAEIVRLCQGKPLSIAELGAYLKLLLAVVKVLVSDLITSGHVIVRTPPPRGTADPLLLQAVLDGVRKL